ncbi:MAG: hypothetical protein NZT61_04140 [Deltaproteobacteria bacterium]|nr:hypothetical protein [Deltaproteobacteria bacterium]
MTTQSDVFISRAVGLIPAGALTSLELGSGVVPGAAVGLLTSGFLSAIEAFSLSRSDESLLQLEAKTSFAVRSAVGQRVILEYLETKKKFHPNRDIFPAKFFFESDSSRLSETGRALLTEIYNLNKDRFPWSRFGIISYVASSVSENDYTQYVIVSQTKAIGNYLVQLGLNPRRITLLGAVITRPLIETDPEIQKEYLNCIEFVPLDLLNVPQSG